MKKIILVLTVGVFTLASVPKASAKLDPCSGCSGVCINGQCLDKKFDAKTYDCPTSGRNCKYVS